MKKNILFFVFVFICEGVLANQFYPEYNKMRIYRCDISETIYNNDNSVVSQNKYFRIFRLDDENKKIYLQKAPVDWILKYDDAVIKFKHSPLADDYIMNTSVTIDRINNTYESETEISYDNFAYSPRKSKAQGTCKYLDQ